MTDEIEETDLVAGRAQPLSQVARVGPQIYCG
jgi:hypothetical protein